MDILEKRIDTQKTQFTRHFVGHPAVCEECEQRRDRGAARYRQGLTLNSNFIAM